MGPRRDWKDARAKVEAEGVCRNCGSPNVETAHVTGRAYDKPKTPGSKTLYVHPDSVIALCGRFGNDCHGAFDRHELDVLSLLDSPEQLKAVEDLGSIESARIRLCPSAYHSEAA